MKTKAISALLSAVFLAGAIAPLAACAEPKTALPVWDTHVEVQHNGETVTWDEAANAVSYRVYAAPSKFAPYEEVQSSGERSYRSPLRYGYYRVEALDQNGNPVKESLYSYDLDTFGENTHVYAATDPQEKIQEDIDSFRAETGQFSEKRFAALFKEGKYDKLDLVMRYYMTFAGLNASPKKTEIARFNTYGELSGGNATCNFWCGIENMSVNSTVQWAVSQATSFRRMNVNGGMFLTDQTGKTAWGSGGFIGDTAVSGTLNSGNQQQWLTRNSTFGTWVNGDINMVYSGCEGKFANADYVWPKRRVTNLPTTNVMREKPFLVFDGDYYVYLPSVKKDTKGISWNKDFDGEILSMDNFYVARADRDDAATLNAALENRKSILFTPGIYRLDKPLLVKNEGTVLMGMGLATLKLNDKNTDSALKIANIDDVSVSGIMIDAGASSQTLMEIGEQKSGVSHAERPIVLNDVYFRIGGAGNSATAVQTALVVNANDVVGDNFWVWRADHGNGGTVGWELNRATNGVVVNGDNVTVYGLMVEHFQEYQTIWNGENGFVAFYQSETPYDPPTQEDWMSEWKGTKYKGWASYKVADSVQKHTAHGIGVYYVASKGLKNEFDLDHAIELPSNAGIRVEHMATANFLNFGGRIHHIVNEYGEPCYDGVKKQFTSFIGGVATP